MKKIEVEQTLAISSWIDEERPREKLAMWGKNSMSLTELLAIIIGSGTKQMNAIELARMILKEHEAHELPYLNISELCLFNGIGSAKAISIIAALEFGKRCARETRQNRSQIKTSEDVYQLMRDKYENLDHEEFWVVFVNAASKVTQIEMISKGGMTKTIVDPVIILKKSIQFMARGIILTHNHPSGNLKVSSADRNLTNKMKELCSLLDINLVDHVVFTDGGYTSFVDEGYL